MALNAVVMAGIVIGIGGLFVQRVEAQAAPRRKLVWSDEFNRPGRPDPKKWDYEVGFVRNGEMQYYTRDRAENARVEGGHLTIEARKEPYQDAKVTSASLTSRQSWTYGRIEVRAKIPTGRGTWPAIWMLGTNIKDIGWPACGEIDIMENVGFDPDGIHCTVHTQAPDGQWASKGNRITAHKPYEGFHVYAVDWDAKRMVFTYDGKQVLVYENDGSNPWPFDKPQYLILNLAIGGSWGGQKGVDDSIFPCKYLIDYVRVYQ
jgi:beta-glucanase (GH16 family)